jgi:hypothetical protein
VLNVAKHLSNLRVPRPLIGIAVTTMPTDYSVINRFQTNALSMVTESGWADYLGASER